MYKTHGYNIDYEQNMKDIFICNISRYKFVQYNELNDRSGKKNSFPSKKKTHNIYIIYKYLYSVIIFNLLAIGGFWE